LPTTLADIGIDASMPERLIPVAQESCKPGSSIHKEAGLVTPEMVYSAMLMADARGRERKEKKSLIYP